MATTNLTDERMEEILKDHGALLLKAIRIEPMLIAKLVERGAIPSDDSETVRAIALPKDAKQHLFDIIKSKLEYFISFCIVLHEDMERDDVVCDKFGLDISDLKHQKGEIKEKRENRRLAQLAKEKEAKDGKKNEEENKRPEEQKPGQETKELPTTDHPATAYKELTYDSVNQLLINHKTAFYDRFDPTTRVLAELESAKVINADVKNKLSAAGITLDEKKDVILETVKRKGVEAFLDFCLLLCKDGIDQEHLVTKVLGLNIDDIRKQRDGQ